jgi:hypothetical protein
VHKSPAGFHSGVTPQDAMKLAQSFGSRATRAEAQSPKHIQVQLRFLKMCGPLRATLFR